MRWALHIVAVASLLSTSAWAGDVVVDLDRLFEGSALAPRNDTAVVQLMEDIASAFEADERLTATIEVHTDDSGEGRTNLERSDARASRLAALLFGLGVDKSRLKMQGFGDAEPVESNRTPEGRKTNRRVVFAFDADVAFGSELVRKGMPEDAEIVGDSSDGSMMESPDAPLDDGGDAVDSDGVDPMDDPAMDAVADDPAVDTSHGYLGFGFARCLPGEAPIVEYITVDSSAAAHGMQLGDRLVEVSGKDTTAMGEDEILKLLRGKPGEKKTIQVERDGGDLGSRLKTRSPMTILLATPTGEVPERTEIAGGAFREYPKAFRGMAGDEEYLAVKAGCTAERVDYVVLMPDRPGAVKVGIERTVGTQQVYVSGPMRARLKGNQLQFDRVFASRLDAAFRWDAETGRLGFRRASRGADFLRTAVLDELWHIELQLDASGPERIRDVVPWMVRLVSPHLF